MASPRNQHCANCIGALSFPISSSQSPCKLEGTITICTWCSFSKVGADAFQGLASIPRVHRVVLALVYSGNHYKQ